MRVSRMLLTTLAVLLAARGAVAAPLEGKQVAADAQWVVHVDFDAMRDSGLGKYVRDTAMKTDDAQEKLKKFQDDTGADLTKDIHSVTLYDNRFVENSGVAIIRASHVDHDKLLQKLQAAHPDHEKSTHGNHDLYTWQEKGRHGDHTMTGAFFGDEAVIFSRDAKQVERALDVLDGKSAGLAADSKLIAAPPAGAFVVVRGIGMDQQETPFHLELVRKSKQLSLAFGQDGGDVYLHGKLVTQNDKTAAQVNKAIDGWRSIVELMLNDPKIGDDNAKSILTGLKAATDGDTVTLEWKASGEDVINVMKKQQEKMKQRRAEREKSKE